MDKFASLFPNPLKMDLRDWEQTVRTGEQNKDDKRVRPQSHLLYGEDKAAVRPLN